MNQRPDLKSVTIPWGGGTYSGAVSNGVPDNLGKWSHPDGHNKSLALRTVFQIGEFHIYVHWSVLVVVACFPIGLVYAYELERSVFSFLNICMVSTSSPTTRRR